MNERYRNFMLALLIIGILSMTIIYATFAQRLNITSYTTVKKTDWDIHYENLQSSRNNDPKLIKSSPIIDRSTIISGLEVGIEKPGDKIVYTFDIVNNGDFDAKITSFELNQGGIICIDKNGSTTSLDARNVCDNLKYTLKYTNDTTKEQTGEIISAGEDIGLNQILKKHQRVNVTLTIDYSVNATSVADDITISGLDTYIIYSQN